MKSKLITSELEVRGKEAQIRHLNVSISPFGCLYMILALGTTEKPASGFGLRS